MKVRTRRASVEDVSAIRRLLQRDVVAGDLSNQYCYVPVVFGGGSLIGCGAVTFSRELGRYAGHFTSAYVAEGSRGYGAGRALWRAVEDEARKFSRFRGGSLDLFGYSDGEASEHLFRSRGWEQLGVGSSVWALDVR